MTFMYYTVSDQIKVKGWEVEPWYEHGGTADQVGIKGSTMHIPHDHKGTLNYMGSQLSMGLCS